MILRRQNSTSGDLGSTDISSDSHGEMILGISGFFTAFACVTVILRMYVRISLLKMMGSDDYVMLIAMLVSATIFALLVAEVRLGVGEHSNNPRLIANYQEILRLSYFHAFFLVMGVSSVKISVGLFLLRLVQGPWYKRCIIGWTTFLLAFTVACVATLVFQCHPIDAAWSSAARLEPGASCFDLKLFRDLGLFNGSVNSFTDFVFASLPIPIILSLQMDMRTKISLICILSLGYFACVAAIVKLKLLSTFFNNSDNLFNDAFNVWSVVELNTGILAACLPTLRPLFSYFKNATTNLSTSGYSGTRSIDSRRRYFPQEDGKELVSVGSHSNKSAKYGVRVSGGYPYIDDADWPLRRQGSVGSGSPSSRLEKAIEGDDSDIEEMSRSFSRAYIKRERSRDWGDERIWADAGKGILRTTEFSVTR